MNYYSHCVSIADKAAKIENASERYYSKKARFFGEVLKRELYKKKLNAYSKLMRLTMSTWTNAILY